MKKPKMTLISLKFNKTKIASLHQIKAGAVDISTEPDCETRPYECNTIKSRSDSLS